MKQTTQILVLLFFTHFSFTQTTYTASGADICMGYEMNVAYTEYNVWNGAPIYGNFADSDINKYIGWYSGKWFLLVWDWNISAYVYLWENSTGTMSAPPLTGWIPTSN